MRPRGEDRRGRQAAAGADSGRPPGSPAWLCPARRCPPQSPLQPGPMPTRGTGGPALTAAPSCGSAAGCQSPAATPKPSQIHPTLTRTHVRLFPKRKGPSISNHSPVPSSGSPRSRFAGPSPARLPALTACKSTGADGFPGQGVAGNQVSPLEVGVEPKMKALGHSTRCGFTGGQPHHWPQHEAPRTCLRHARPPVCLSACLPCPQPPARLSGFKENSCTSQGDGQTPARPGPQPS